MRAEPPMAAGANSPDKRSISWRRLRIATQIISFLFFLAIFILIPQNKIGTPVLSIPFKLSPLVMLGSSLASRVVIPGLALAVVFLLFSLVFGRAWCGWMCPLGSVLEVFPIRRKRTRVVPETWRKGKYILLVAFVTAAALGSLVFIVLDPLTIFYRTFTFVLWPALSFLLQALETSLYSFSFLQSFISWIDGFLRPSIFPISQLVFSQSLLFFAIFLALIFLNYFSERFWCRYLCPLGGLLGWISRIALLKREVTSDCITCGKCARVCQTGTVDDKYGYRSDPAECTLCMDCITACPNNSNRFVAKIQPGSSMPYDPSRREALLTIGAVTAGVAVANTQAPHQAGLTFLIRPPGVTEADFLSRCARCGDCFRICPTNALQPSLFEGGISGFWTPFLVPRIGYCDYACNACGQICPVQAIPPLSLDEKRLAKIGSAYINQNLCIAWADDRDCIVCEEMCPLPEKAIRLQKRGNGKQASAVLVPVVNRELCIGCGICENKCPVVGQAAIQVRIPQNS